MNYEVKRISDACCEITNDLFLDVKLFANKDVFVERDAFDELFGFLDVERAVRDIHASNSTFLDKSARINRVVLTPD